MNKNEIKITKKSNLKGEDGTKVVSLRIKEDLLAKVEDIANKANRSRNELINIIIENSIEYVVIEEIEQNESV